MGGIFSAEDIRATLFSDNRDTRKKFLQHFGSEIDNFVSAISRSYTRLEEMPPRVPYDKRSAWVDEFLFAAFNSLVTSFHLLISGFNIPSGNLMRHYGEATAMALLLSHWQINAFDLLEKDFRFPVHKALDIVKRNRNAELLGVSKQGWEKFIEITSFYDQYSHPSIFAAASTHIFSLPGSRQVGGEFDLEKKDSYQKEIRLAIGAAQRLYETIEVAERHLINSKAPNQTLQTDRSDG
jgi:hypothetical protein